VHNIVLRWASGDGQQLRPSVGHIHFEKRPNTRSSLSSFSLIVLPLAASSCSPSSSSSSSSRSPGVDRRPHSRIACFFSLSLSLSLRLALTEREHMSFSSTNRWMIPREWYQMDDTSGVISSYHPIADLAIALLACIALVFSCLTERENAFFIHRRMDGKSGMIHWVIIQERKLHMGVLGSMC
jgi:hypothetical protein